MSIASEAPSSGSLAKFMSSLQEDLYDALRAGHVEKARDLLRQGAKVDSGICGIFFSAHGSHSMPIY